MRKFCWRKNKIKTSDIRQSFVDYFIKKDHRQYSSSPVIPFGDPTLLFANAGMNQFKDIFTGRKKAEYPRAVTVQKCMRAGGKHNDLENVGRTGRHHTFFEMLGNFSFGDYFKEQAIHYCWEYITQVLNLPKDKLYATVFKDDDEAFGLWEKIAPELKNGRILRFDEKENYWSMGETGPNGPCSELHFDRGEKFGTGPDDVVNGTTERFVEIWNLVFMQYNTRPDGTTEPLPKPSVDTGAGLERISCVLQNAESDYEIDVFSEIINHIQEITGQKYYTDERGVSHRIIADHVRALTVCLADGGGISNEKQGYVLRRILRRAARHGRKLGMHEPFIWKLVPDVVRTIGDFYTEVNEKLNHIGSVIQGEEESFGRTLDNGLAKFENIMAYYNAISDPKSPHRETWERLEKSGAIRRDEHFDGNMIKGKIVFEMWDTFGFPPDLTKLMAEERGLTIDMDGFQKAMERQKEQSRSSSDFRSAMIENHKNFIDALKQTGYDFNRATHFDRNNDSLITRVVSASKSPFPHVAVVLESTPFYVEAGGQIGDTGKIISDNVEIDIEMAINHQGSIIHAGTVIKGDSKDFDNLAGKDVQVNLDSNRRRDIMRNHTATHLLHAALRKVLGEHVKQSGSYVGPDKLRFDYSHFKPMTAEEINKVEQLVNDKILTGQKVETVEDSLENAKKAGAMAIFGEKYESRVRVVSVGYFSRELCGGTHVENVSQIGPFMITLETALASGVRRIEAVTGTTAVEMMLLQKRAFGELERITGKPESEVARAVADTYEKLLELQKENRKLKAERFSSGSVAVGDEKIVGDMTVRYHDFGNIESEEMAGWIDGGKGASGQLVSAAVGIIDGKRTFMSSASGAVKLHIGKLTGEVLKEIGGKGGGKPNFARGSIPAEIDSQKVFEIFIERLEKK